MEEPREEWTRSAIMKLIELYKSQDCLWNTNNIGYRDKRKRCNAWKHIASSLGHDVMNVERKMKVLKTQFMHCYKLQKKYSSNGEAYQPKWFGYKSMKFLIPGKIIREKREMSRMNEEDLKIIKLEPVDTSCENDCEYQDSSLKMNLQITDIDANTKYEESNRCVFTHVNVSPHGTPVNAKYDSMKQSFYNKPRLEALNQESSSRDEFTIFGELIACRLRKIKNVRTKLTVQFNITNLLFDAEMQEIDEERATRTLHDPNLS
ncbi:hypothetical protein WA026_015727 [Henosepilachna vigintioctopunctata]